MRNLVQLGIILLFALLGTGLVLPAVIRVRNAQNIVRCGSNLRNIGLALQQCHDFKGYFPTGTLPNAGLPPEKRLSWVVQVWPAFMEGGHKTLFDETKAWDDQENCPPRQLVRVNSDPPQYEERLVGELPIFLCPANPARTMPPLPSPTHYLGIAGLGEDAAELPLSDPGAGFFGNDRKVSLRDLKDGLATTMTVAEGLNGGPWTAGGQATVRGLSAGVPYLGNGGQFAANHRGYKTFHFSQPVVTNVLFADASVRPLTASVSPQVFEALATIAGGEEVGRLDDAEK